MDRFGEIVAAVLFLLISYTLAKTTLDLKTDESSLLVFKSHMTRDSSYSTTLEKNWTTENSVCKWIGVTCGTLHHRVIALDIPYMGLKGTIPPHIGNLSFLISLNIRGNFFKGFVPEELSRLRRLKVARFSSNHFGGELPKAWFGNSSSLEELYVDDNNFDGSIPPEIGKLYKLKVIDLSWNKLSGPIPTQIGNLTRLFRLRLYGNNLDGTIPHEIGRLNNLNFINLGENQLSGTIPFTIGNLSSLCFLIMDTNNLTGQIPPSLCNLSVLFYLRLSDNKLQGRIPQCLGNFSTSLSLLALKDNELRGPILTTFADGNNMKYLTFNGNKLQGPLSKSLLKCQNLQLFDVGNNEIQDSFPDWIATLPELRVLVMTSNRFYGTLLPDDNDGIHPFPKLHIFDISHNKFSGALPSRYLENFVSMMNVRINDSEARKWFQPNRESVQLVLKGSEQMLVTILAIFTIIDFSDNQFNGSIPHSIGKLNSLIYMNLSHNLLQGEIPTSFVDLSQLEQLDLSSNRLQGGIPWQLTRLSFLSVLNLSYNHLSGSIPQFPGQFSTFENNSYIENYGLCGYPLTRKCKNDDKASPSEGDDSEFLDGFTWKSVVIGYGCGFVFGVTMGCLALLYTRPLWLLNIFFRVRPKRRRRLARQD